MYTQSGVVCCIGTCRTEHADTKEIERVAIDAVGAMKSGETAIWDRFGAKWACCESEQPALQLPWREISIRGAWRVDQVLASEGQVFSSSRTAFQ